MDPEPGTTGPSEAAFDPLWQTGAAMARTGQKFDTGEESPPIPCKIICAPRFTKIPNYGQIEIDELYVGLDSAGAQYIVPVQAKGGNDTLGVIQTIQDTIFCPTKERYRHCVARPVSAQFMADDTIAMFELTFDGDDVSIVREKHYRLTEARDIGEKDLAAYGIPEPD